MLEEDPENDNGKLVLKADQLVISKTEVGRGKPRTRFVSLDDGLELQVIECGILKPI
jgi:hypothetical protein